MKRNILIAAALMATAAAAPNTASWDLLILAFGTVGAVLRRRRAALALAV